jgi:hypothetical protein
MILLKACMSFTEKKQDYKSDILKISGFALTTPLGRIFIEPTVVFNEFGFQNFIGYLVLCLTLTMIGATLIYTGYDTLEK